MSDRSAFGRMFGADFEQVFDAVLRDSTQLGMAITQISAGRKVRIMGALRGDGTGNREKNLNVASMVYNLGEMFRKSHFMEIFIDANLLMMRFAKNRNYAKLTKLKGQLVYFYVTYEAFTTIMEGALERFDLYFDQWAILTTMGLRPPEQKEERMAWLAADETALEGAMQDQQRAREAWREDIPESIDDFMTAFKEARDTAQKLTTLITEYVEPPDTRGRNKKIKTLAEELAKEIADLPEKDRSKRLAEMMISLVESTT